MKRIVSRSAVPMETRDAVAVNPTTLGAIGTGLRMPGQRTATETVAAIINALASDIGNTEGIKLRARQLGTDKDVTDTNEWCRAWNVQASDTVTSSALRIFTSYSFDLIGEQYLVANYGPRGQFTITPLIGYRVEPLFVGPGVTNPDGSPAYFTGYLVRNQGGADVARYDATGQCVAGADLGILFRPIVPAHENPYLPQSLIKTAGLSIEGVHYAKLAVRSMMANSGQPAGLIQILDQDIEQEGIDDFSTRINSTLSDPTQKGRTLVVGAQMAYTQLGASDLGTSWTGITEAMTRDLLRVWGMPLSRLGDEGPKGKTYENKATEIQAYYTDAVVPRLNLISSSMNLVVRNLGFELYWDLSGIAALREDGSNRIAAAVSLWSSGLVTRDTALGVAGLPPAETAGDAYNASPVAPQPEPVAAPSRDAGPKVRAAKSPHALAVTLDSQIDDGIDSFGAFAQRYHVRVFKRIAGAMRGKATRDAFDGEDTDTPTGDAGDYFQQDSFDTELHSDTQDELRKVAKAALAMLAAYYGVQAIADLPAKAKVVESRLRGLMNGTAQRVSWNDAIGRDLQRILVKAREEQMGVDEVLAHAADMLGVELTDTGAVAAEQGIGARAMAIATRTVHGAVNDLALETYSAQGELKSWHSMGDGKVRDSHAEADATYSENPIPVDQPFEVGGALLDYPGDANGPPEETDGCRCVVVPA